MVALDHAFGKCSDGPTQFSRMNARRCTQPIGRPFTPGSRILMTTEATYPFAVGGSGVGVLLTLPPLPARLAGSGRVLATMLWIR